MKRRKVLRAAFVYVVMAWLLLQITDVVGPILDLPAWVAKLVFFLLLGGLPVMLILAWYFDLTNLGIYREQPLRKDGVNADPVEGNRALKRTINHIACLWVVFVGTGLSVGAAAVIHLHEAHMIERQFDLIAQEIAHEIKHHLTSDGEALHTLGALFRDNREPELDTFRQLSEKVIAGRDEIEAIEWVPLVMDDERMSFVERMKEVYPGFEIKTFDANGDEQPSVQRARYFPVTYAVPRVGNEAAIGFDLSSNPDRAKALNEAILSGTTRQSGAVRLVQSGIAGFLMFHPVFQDDEVPVSKAARLDSLRGFMLGVVNVQVLVAAAVATTPGAAGFLGEIAMHEGEAVSDVPVTSIDTSNGSELSASTRAVAAADGGFGLKWLVELRPTRALMVEQFSSEHYVVCVVGILLSITGAMVMNAMSASKVMPNKAGGLAEARGQVTDEDLLEPAPGQGDLPEVADLVKEQDWRVSKWRSS
jgi:CHASE1-domain containing sensor protein